MNVAFPPQPGGMQPPVMAPGQHMGPAQGHPGQVGHPMGIHPGVSGAGPHVTQASPMMAGMQMQPGMAHNAHALSHPTPTPQMIPQQMQHASKPDLLLPVINDSMPVKGGCPQ